VLRSVALSSIALTVSVLVLVAAAVLAAGGGPAAAVAWGVALALATRVAPILASFAVALWPRAGHSPPPLGLAGLLRLLAAEGWATIRLFFYYHPGERLVTRRDPAAIVEGHTPLVLVHGFYANAAFWQPMKPALQAAGWRNVFSLNLEPLLADIDDYARQLEMRIEHACGRCGTDSVVVVAHSMGGLVARACDRRAPGRIRHIVCLGSPHHGTVLASLVPSLTTRQMRLGSEWLAALNSDAPQAHITNIFSEHDNIIVPQASAALPGGENITLRGVGHLEMAFSADLRRALDGVLQSIRSVSST